MKNYKESAMRWLKQAEHDLDVAENNLKAKFFSDACFMAEQCFQKALKAYLFSRGERFITMHSVSKLAFECARKNADFEKIIDYAKILDRYYIPTRYPDAIPAPSVPYEEYGQDEAKEAVSYANSIVKLVKSKI